MVNALQVRRLDTETAYLLSTVMPYCDLPWPELLRRLWSKEAWSAWRIEDAGKLLGVAVLVTNAPKCTLWALAAHDFPSWRDEGEKLLVSIAKKRGCSTLECYARPGIAKYFSGWILKKCVFEKEI